jgi:hypothetical protein
MRSDCGSGRAFWVLANACLLGLCWRAEIAGAQYAPSDDPYAYDLRISVFPAAFQAGLSQSSLGSALRAEVDLSRRISLSTVGRFGWLPVLGETDSHGFTLRAGVSWNVVDKVEAERLAGTVYPEDTPAVGERGGVEFETPVSQKLGSPRFALPDVDREARAPIRTVHSVRLGGEIVRAVERSSDQSSDGSAVEHIESTFGALYVGYGWGVHWALSPATVGEREVGWRRFYLDALLRLDALSGGEATSSSQDPAQAASNDSGSFFPLGVRLGMEGSIAALLRRAPGVGFGYSLELGAWPGRHGPEGYLFVGLGLELDFMLRARAEPS